MKYYCIKNFGAACLALFLMTGCNEATLIHGQKVTAMSKIIDYSQYQDEAPSKKDYADAGVVGVDNDEKLAEINEIVEVSDVHDIDTAEEIQEYVNTMLVSPNTVKVFKAVNNTTTNKPSCSSTASATSTCPTATKSTCPTATSSSCPSASKSTCPSSVQASCPNTK